MKRAILFLFVVVAAGCGGAEGPPAGRLAVATSVLPHAWLVRAVGGDRVEVTTMVGPGESPATYQPTDQQVSRVMRATLFFATGVPFEHGGWMRALATTDVQIVDLREGLPLRHLREHRHEGSPEVHSGDDPHVWLSPRLLAVQAETVAAALSGADPANEATYEANLERTRALLADLDRELAGLLEAVRGRRLYVFHPSWGYFLDDYGLEQVPIEIEGKEPSESQITELVASARRDGVKVIFVQPQIAGQTAEAVAKAVGAVVRRLDPLAEDLPANLREVAKRIAAALE